MLLPQIYCMSLDLFILQMSAAGLDRSTIQTTQTWSISDSADLTGAWLYFVQVIINKICLNSRSLLASSATGEGQTLLSETSPHSFYKHTQVLSLHFWIRQIKWTNWWLSKKVTGKMACLATSDLTTSVALLIFWPHSPALGRSSFIFITSGRTLTLQARQQLYFVFPGFLFVELIAKRDLEVSPGPASCENL